MLHTCRQGHWPDNPGAVSRGTSTPGLSRTASTKAYDDVTTPAAIAERWPCILNGSQCPPQRRPRPKLAHPGRNWARRLQCLPRHHPFRRFFHPHWGQDQPRNDCHPRPRDNRLRDCLHFPRGPIPAGLRVRFRRCSYGKFRIRRNRRSKETIRVYATFVTWFLPSLSVVSIIAWQAPGPPSSVESIFSQIDSILRTMRPRCVHIRSQTRLIVSLVFISVLQNACRKQVCSDISSISWATSSGSEVSR